MKSFYTHGQQSGENAKLAQAMIGGGEIELTSNDLQQIENSAVKITMYGNRNT